MRPSLAIARSPPAASLACGISAHIGIGRAAGRPEQAPRSRPEIASRVRSPVFINNVVSGSSDDVRRRSPGAPPFVTHRIAWPRRRPATPPRFRRAPGPPHSALMIFRPTVSPPSECAVAAGFREVMSAAGRVPGNGTYSREEQAGQRLVAHGQVAKRGAGTLRQSRAIASTQTVIARMSGTS
jgi:hypothetical protein